MAFFNASSPAYKKAASLNASAYAPATASNGLASMFGSLLGGTTPVYKTVDTFTFQEGQWNTGTLLGGAAAAARAGAAVRRMVGPAFPGPEGEGAESRARVARRAA